MASAIDSKGHLSFAPNDTLISKLNALGIAWDVCDVRVSDIDLSDNTYQTRKDVGSTDEEFVLRYMAAYRNGDILPMPLFVAAWSARNQPRATVAPCAGRHRGESARRVGAKTMTILRAFVRTQGDVDALKDISVFDNANNGKSISTDDIYAYCAREVITKNGGYTEGMPSPAFVKKMFLRWEDQGVNRNTLQTHIKALLTKDHCNAMGVETPAGHVETFSKLYSWNDDPAFDQLSSAVCRSIDNPEVRKCIKSPGRHKSAADVLSMLVRVSRGYGGQKEQMNSADFVRLRCREIRKRLAKLESEPALDFEMLGSIAEQVDDLYTETQEIVTRLRAQIGGVSCLAGR